MSHLMATNIKLQLAARWQQCGSAFNPWVPISTKIKSHCHIRGYISSISLFCKLLITFFFVDRHNKSHFLEDGTPTPHLPSQKALNFPFWKIKSNQASITIADVTVLEQLQCHGPGVYVYPVPGFCSLSSLLSVSLSSPGGGGIWSSCSQTAVSSL